MDQAILAVEQVIAGTSGRRRGRPPKGIVSLSANGVNDRPKRTLSAAARKRIAQAQKKRWAAKRSQAKKATS